MDQNPYEPSQQTNEPRTEPSRTGDEPTGRESANRLIGLGSYAMSILMVCLVAFAAYDEIHQRGFAGLIASIKKDPAPAGVAVAATIVFWAIGFTTGRRPKQGAK